MNKDDNSQKGYLRSEVRAAALQGGSIEFKPSENAMVYQFGLRDWSGGGLGILVRNDSDIFNHIQVGQVISIILHRGDGNISKAPFEAEIRHISEPDNGRHPDHKIVGLLMRGRDC